MRRCDRAACPRKIRRHFKETPWDFAIDPISDSAVISARADVRESKTDAAVGPVAPACAPRQDAIDRC
jgi:hypothetical protein